MQGYVQGVVEFGWFLLCCWENFRGHNKFVLVICCYSHFLFWKRKNKIIVDFHMLNGYVWLLNYLWFISYPCIVDVGPNWWVWDYLSVLKVSVKQENCIEETITVRLYGPNTEYIIDRQRELQVRRCAAWLHANLAMLLNACTCFLSQTLQSSCADVVVVFILFFYFCKSCSLADG